MKASSFINNSYLTTTLRRLLKPGGALTFKGNYLLLSDLFCTGNNGFKGGFLFFDSNVVKNQELIIRFSVFFLNVAMSGGVFGITTEVKNMQYLFSHNYFKANEAASNNLIFLFCKKSIFYCKNGKLILYILFF